MNDVGGPLRGPVVAHIVPGLIPGECGIGDYAVTVAQGLAAQGIGARFLVTGRELAHRADEFDSRGDFPVTALAEGDASGLEQALADPAIDVAVLHYTGYGYHWAGMPDWLAQAMAAVRRRRANLRIVTFFHEIWERWVPWKRALYRSGPQRRVARRLCRVSDVILANTTTRARMLGRYHPDGCRAVPVFSNVGENLDAAVTDPDLAVTFGLGRRRQMVWSRLAEQGDLLGRLGVSRVADIGTRSFALPPSLDGIAQPQGRLASAEVSALLSRAGVALICYGDDDLGKSGVFAAFAAHRLCVVNFGRAGEGSADGLKRGVHYLHPEDVASGLTPERRDAVAANLADWYRPHTVASNVALFLDIVRTTGRHRAEASPASSSLPSSSAAAAA